MKYVKNVWIVIVCLLGSYYLTWCVNKTTLETWLQKVFVFIYFLVMLGFFLLLRCRYLKRLKITFRDKVVKGLLSIVIASVILTANFDIFVGWRYNSINLSITALGETGQTHAEQKSTEVWLTKIILDERLYDLSKIPLTPDWEYRDDTSLLSHQNQPSTISFELPGSKNTEISFLSHPWSGEVLVESNQRNQKLDLYRAEEQGNCDVTLFLPGERQTFSVWDWMAIIACFIVLLSIIDTVGCFLIWCESIKTENNSTSSPNKTYNYKMLYILAVFIGIVFLIFRYASIEPYSKTYFSFLCGIFSVLLILTTVAYLAVLKEHNIQIYNMRALVSAIILSVFVVLLLANNLYNLELRPTFTAAFYLQFFLLFSLCTLTLYFSFYIMSSRFLGVIVSSFLLSIVLPLSGWLRSWTTEALLLETLFLFSFLFFALYILREKFDLKYRKSEKAVNILTLPFFVCITIFSVFLWSYNKIVLSPNEIQGGISIIGFLGISAVYAAAFGISILKMLRLIKNKISKEWITASAIEIQKKEPKVFPKLLIFMILYWLIWLIAYFPANMSPDSVDQWGQAIGVRPLIDAHPIFATLWIRMCIFLWKSPAMVILMQIILTAVILAYIFNYFSLWKFNKKVLLALGCAVALLPNASVYVVTQWKDVVFLLALLVLAFLMQKTFMDKKIGILGNIALVITLIGVALLRHNGFLISLICGLVLLFVALKKRLLYSVVSIVLAVAFVLLFNGPIYKALDVKHYGIGLAGIVTDCVGYTIYYDGEIPEDILEEATQTATVDFWKAQFTPFHAFNYIYNGEYNLSLIYANKSSTEQISIILRLFYHNPNIIFYERMAMNDTNLFVNQSEAQESLNARYSNSIYTNDFGLAHKDTMLKTLLDKFLSATSWQNFFWDSLLWRNGVMICIAAWVIYFNFIQKRWIRNIIFLPMIINFLTLFIALVEQSYRFTHNIVPYLIIAILFSIMPDKADEHTNAIFVKRHKSEKK